MGCNQSSITDTVFTQRAVKQVKNAPVTAKDFYYKPSYRSLRHIIDDNVQPITHPGMCYAFSLNKNDTKNRWKSQRSGLTCQRFTDTNNGESAIDGLHLTGPAPCGKMFVRDAKRTIVAILKPMHHGRTACSFEILCPKPYDQSCPKGDNSCQQRNQNKEECSSRPTSSEHGNEAYSSWYTWATVTQEPHVLTFRLTLAGSTEQQQSKPPGATYYRLHYCKNKGGEQMRIDNHNGELRAMIQIRPDNNKRARKSLSWDAIVGAGVDPTLMLCFAAIVNQPYCPVRFAPGTGNRIRW